MKTKLLSSVVLTIVTILGTASIVGAKPVNTSDTSTAPRKVATSTTNEQTNRQCTAITTFAAKIQAEQSKRSSDIQSKLEKISTDTSNRQSERNTKLAEARAKWDAQRQENFTKLRAKATSAEQKQAVEEYIATITRAISTRRAANDAAFAAFRDELAALKTSVGESVSSSLSDNSSKTQEAITQAQTACQGGQDATTVKQQLQSALKSIQQSNKQLRESIQTSRKTQIEAAVQKRKDAVKANDAAFETAAKEARQKLLAAFGDKKTTIQ